MSYFSDQRRLRALYEPPADPSAERFSCFPLPWYEEFLRQLRERDVELLTWSDLFRDSDDWDHQGGFKREFEHWHRRLRNPRKAYLLIQHDVDNVPDFTKRLVALEAAHGVRSSIFLFRDRFSEGCDEPPYVVDHAFFQEAQRQGFDIGYHQNAYALAGFDMDAAVERYRQDLEFLGNLYDIRFVVPHGGRGREVNGRKLYNHDVPMPATTRGRVRWVYNKYGATFSGRWSDGGLHRLTSSKRMADFDIVGDFLQKLEKGKRYFMLVHPQRWGFNLHEDCNPFLLQEPWYHEVRRRWGVPTTCVDAD